MRTCPSLILLATAVALGATAAAAERPGDANALPSRSAPTAAASQAAKPQPPQTATDTANVAQGEKAAGIAFIANETSSQILASSILSMSIQNRSGDDAKRIGTVNDLIMDKHHKLVGIVVGVGGFLGMGQKNVGIPWSAVANVNSEKRVAVVNVTKAELQEAPAFATTQDQSHTGDQKEKERQLKLKALEARATTHDSIYFAYNDAHIAPRYQFVIEAWSAYLRAAPDVKIELQGTAGPHGSQRYNDALGRQRALAVQSALIANGVPESQLSITSSGKDYPVCTQATDACRQDNRRVDFIRP